MPEMRGGISDSVVARAEIDPSRAMEHVPASVSMVGASILRD